MIFNLGLVFGLNAQTPEEVLAQEETMSHTEHVHHFYNYNNNQNEMEMLLAGLFLFYKNFISSQDANKCSFYPSCSQYGINAVKERGIVIGIISTFDRLLRCNGLSPEKYHIHEETGLLYDPVN